MIVVSSDFTHYGRSFNYVPFTENVAEQLRIQAREAAKPLLNADYDGFVDYLARTKDTICGRRPILLLMRVLAMQGGASAVRTGFDTSGRMTGDYAGSVTYQSFVFAARELTLPADARGALLKLARRTAIAHLNKERLEKISPADLPEAARADGACFVTLENRGVLRGCIAPGVTVPAGCKIGDIDPRGDAAYCFVVSDKARSLGGAVLTAVLGFVAEG